MIDWLLEYLEQLNFLTQYICNKNINKLSIFINIFKLDYIIYFRHIIKLILARILKDPEQLDYLTKD